MSEKIISMMHRSFTALYAFDKYGLVGEWLRFEKFGATWKRVIWRAKCHD